MKMNFMNQFRNQFKKKAAQFFIFFLFAAIGSGCNKSDSKNNLPAAPVQEDPRANESDEGGISAGGGGTLPANPIGIYRVNQIIDLSKRQLRLYFNDFRRSSTGYAGGTWRYYYGENNLATQLEKTDIEVLQDKPCKDRLGRDADASIVASRPSTICISAFRIAPKLVEEIANKEILALLVHELSHFLGASEKEAVEIQQFAAIRLSEVSAKSAENDEMSFWGASMPIEQLQRLNKVIEKAASENDLVVIAGGINELSSVLGAYEKFLDQRPFAFADFVITDYEEIILAKLRLAEIFIKSIDPKNAHQGFQKELYERCFNGQLSSTVIEFSENDSCYMGLDKTNLYADYTISKLTSLAELHGYLNEVFWYSNDLSSHMRAISFNGVLPYFKLPTNAGQVNPWSKLIGKYSASLMKCSTVNGEANSFTKGITAIEISNRMDHYPVENTPSIDLVERGSNFMSTFQIGFGAGQYGTMQLFGDDQSAQAVDAHGNRWFDRQGHGWNRTTRSIKPVDGQLVYTFLQESFKYDYRGLWERTIECQFLLEKDNQ